MLKFWQTTDMNRLREALLRFWQWSSELELEKFKHNALQVKAEVNITMASLRALTYLAWKVAQTSKRDLELQVSSYQLMVSDDYFKPNVLIRIDEPKAGIESAMQKVFFSQNLIERQSQPHKYKSYVFLLDVALSANLILYFEAQNVLEELGALLEEAYRYQDYFEQFESAQPVVVDPKIPPEAVKISRNGYVFPHEGLPPLLWPSLIKLTKVKSIEERVYEVWLLQPNNVLFTSSLEQPYHPLPVTLFNWAFLELACKQNLTPFVSFEESKITLRKGPHVFLKESYDWLKKVYSLLAS